MRVDGLVHGVAVCQSLVGGQLIGHQTIRVCARWCAVVCVLLCLSCAQETANEDARQLERDMLCFEVTTLVKALREHHRENRNDHRAFADLARKTRSLDHALRQYHGLPPARETMTDSYVVTLMNHQLPVGANPALTLASYLESLLPDQCFRD